MSSFSGDMIDLSMFSKENQECIRFYEENYRIIANHPLQAERPIRLRDEP